MNDTLGQLGESEQTPGQIIKAAREARQISMSEVAQRLLLSKQIITAIEEDDYSKISAKVYAEGYLKAYAQFLQIPVDTLLASFRRLNVYSDLDVNTETKAQVNDSAIELKRRRTNFILLVVLLVLILGLLMTLVIKSYINKNTDVTNISRSSSEVVEQKPLPIVTTDGGSDTVDAIPDKNPKVQDTSIVEEKNASDSLMLDDVSEEVVSKKNIKRK